MKRYIGHRIEQLRVVIKKITRILYVGTHENWGKYENIKKYLMLYPSLIIFCLCFLIPSYASSQWMFFIMEIMPVRYLVFINFPFKAAIINSLIIFLGPFIGFSFWFCRLKFCDEDVRSKLLNLQIKKIDKLKIFAGSIIMLIMFYLILLGWFSSAEPSIGRGRGFYVYYQSIFWFSWYSALFQFVVNFFWLAIFSLFYKYIFSIFMTYE